MQEHRTLRIGIEATPMLVAQRTGIENYTSALVKEMVAISRNEANLNLHVFLHGGNPFVSQEYVKETVEWLASQNVFWRLYPYRRAYGPTLAAYALMDRLDLLHFPRPTAVRFLTRPYVVTVHDVRAVGLTEEGQRLEHAEVTSSETRAILGATALIANSSSARDDLLSYFGRNPKIPMEIIHLGVDEVFFDAWKDSERIRNQYKLDQSLFVGTLQYRKNLPALIEAFALVKRDHAVPHKLVLAGRDSWGAEQVYAAVRDHHVEEEVLFLGYVPDEDLPGLFSAADLFAYPSLHEGFGIPILEAMASGTVVLTSNAYSMPEVAGDAAVLVNPHEVRSIAAGLWRALSDVKLREACIAKGAARSQQFTWRQTARLTYSFYNKVIAQ